MPNTELWFRDPWNYIREVAETGHCKVTWSFNILRQKKIDPVVSSELYFEGQSWEALTVGSEGACHFKPGSSVKKPIAVYPTYDAATPVKQLESLLNYPVGESKKICSDKTIERYIRPVYGQAHIVVMYGLPNLSTSRGKEFLFYVQNLQEAFPEAKILVRGMGSFRFMFGGNLKAVDFNPRFLAASNQLFLPCGLRSTPRWVKEVMPQYLEMFDMTPKQMLIPRNRCIYNMKSALWAAKHYDDEVRYVVRKGKRGSDKEMNKPDGPDDEPYDQPYDNLPKTQRYLVRSKKTDRGDKFQCNICSLQLSCKLFRVGAVCAVPGAEPVKLAKFFGTRDSDQIINGLAILVQGQMNRLEGALLEEEEIKEGLDPEVSKELSRAFNNGVKLAQLVDPNLRPGAKVNVNLTSSAQAVGNATPAQIISEVIVQLEMQGIKRENITSDMVTSALSAMAAGRKVLAIDGHVE